MVVMFVLGFFLDFIEIIFVVVPIVGPVILQMDVSPIWLGVMIAINLLIGGMGTTSFFMGSVVVFLGRNPAHRQQLLDDPGLVPGAIDELLPAR